jgi:hypothetical protein
MAALTSLALDLPFGCSGHVGISFSSSSLYFPPLQPLLSLSHLSGMFFLFPFPWLTCSHPLDSSLSITAAGKQQLPKRSAAQNAMRVAVCSPL